MGVDGRGLNVVVAEQELDVTDAGPSPQQVGREAVPKSSRGQSKIFQGGKLRPGVAIYRYYASDILPA